MNLLLVAGHFSPLLIIFFFLQGTNRWIVHTFLERAISMSLWLHAICFRPKYNIQQEKRQHKVTGYHVGEHAGLTCFSCGGQCLPPGPLPDLLPRCSGHTASHMPDGTPPWQDCGSPGHREPLGDCHCSHITAQTVYSLTFHSRGRRCQEHLFMPLN